MLTHTQRRLVNSFLGSFESVFVEPFLDLRSVNINPIFLVGPPRSGTTVIYRWFSYYLNGKIAYITRLADLYPDGAFLLNWIGLKIYGKKLEIQSPHTYGQVKGFTALAEGNRLWPWCEESLEGIEKYNSRYLFDRTDYQKEKCITPAVYYFLHKVLRKQCLLMDSKLLINKSVHNTIQILDLKQLFPTAKFIGIIRDGRSVTKSLITARIDIQGSSQKWWGVKPSNWEESKLLPPHLSCGKQWEGLLNDMENQLEQLPENDYKFIRYEDFLSKPYEEMEKIYKHFKLDFKFSSNQMGILKKPIDYKDFFKKQELIELNETISDKLIKWGYK